MLSVRRAADADIPQVMEIYDAARKFMRKTGNTQQWVNGYPQEDLIKEDIAAGRLYVVEDSKGKHGVFALLTEEEPTYAKIYKGKWISDTPYVTIHRLAGDGTEHGIFKTALDFSWGKRAHIRVDTHRDNLPMQRQCLQNGFLYCGIIYLSDGTERLAYEKC